MLTAAPVILKPLLEIGAPGMTDFTNIYIASELNAREHRTTLRHEQAHVWAGHNYRRPPEAVDAVWKTACEMEIARNIYNDNDIDTIKAPRSRLFGGFLPDSVAGLPDEVLLAEDIYDWLLANPQSVPKNKMVCACTFCGGDDPDEQLPAAPSKTIKAVRELLDAEDTASKAQIGADSAYVATRDRPPSLTSAIDAALRVRVERERSHRRPSRRHNDNTILMPGAISTPRPPLVEIFVDRSGSFSPEKTKDAEVKLKAMLTRYRASVRFDVFYFGNGSLRQTDMGGGGNTPYHLIATHLSDSRPKLAVIITDGDAVDQSVAPVAGVNVICVPIGCDRTLLAPALGGHDVVLT